MKKISVSAPGKLMLMGEHAVIYNRPCIVTAIGERLTIHEGNPSGDTRFLDRAIALWGNPGMRLAATSSFSGSYGFGSSSAVTVAALKFLRPDASNKELFDAAYKVVVGVQGKGSGFDVSSAIYGGTLYFVTGGKVIEPISVQNIPLVIGYTGIKADTVTLMKEVSEKMNAQPERVTRIYDAIAKLVNDAKVKMIEGDWERVGKLMDFNHDYLRDLGVSSEKLESLIVAAKQAGAWGAKLSGAGGGDCMIALAPKGKRKDIEDAIKSAGGQVIHSILGAEGVRIEQ